jgi:hypothetical protein
MPRVASGVPGWSNSVIKETPPSKRVFSSELRQSLATVLGVGEGNQPPSNLRAGPLSEDHLESQPRNLLTFSNFPWSWH